jgi:hypothetical protein
MCCGIDDIRTSHTKVEHVLLKWRSFTTIHTIRDDQVDAWLQGGPICHKTKLPICSKKIVKNWKLQLVYTSLHWFPPYFFHVINETFRVSISLRIQAKKS